MKSFKVFDSLAFLNKPSNLGLLKLQSAYAGNIWPTSDHTQLPPELFTKNYFTSLNSSDPCFIDIEHWPVYSLTDEPYRQNLLTILQWFRQVQSIKVGYYSLAPRRDYWRSIRNKRDSQYITWQQENDYVSSIASASDILFPSLYTFYDDIESWKIYAERNIEEARRYSGGKLVYPFILLKYHDSNATLKNLYVPPKDFQEQLHTIYKLADGVVLWGGYLEQWDGNATWWKVVSEFISHHATTY